MIIQKILRGLRRCYRAITDLIEFWKLRYLLFVNCVQYKSIKSFGCPYIAVAFGGVCVIGENFRLNNGIRFNPVGYPQRCQIIVLDNAKLSIGNNVGISQSSLICHHSITIGDNVKIGGGVKVFDTDFHSLNPNDRLNRELDIQNKKVLPVVIKDNAFIGAGSIILKGVTIGKNAIVGAGSVVTKSIPDNEIWGGNPAKFIKKCNNGCSGIVDVL